MSEDPTASSQVGLMSRIPVISLTAPLLQDPKVTFGFWTLGFQTLRFWTLGFLTLRFRTLGFWTLGFRTSGFWTLGFRRDPKMTLGS